VKETTHHSFMEDAHRNTLNLTSQGKISIKDLLNFEMLKSKISSSKPKVYETMPIYKQSFNEDFSSTGAPTSKLKSSK